MIAYPIGSSGETVIFTENVLRHFDQHRQRHIWHREAGGLLFADIADKTITVVEVTGPRRTDYRARYLYMPDRRAEQREINELYVRGLHYIGDWHSHPQRLPSPSSDDRRTMASRVKLSRHQLNGFVFVIVGLASFPGGLTVLVHDARDHHQLSPLPELGTCSARDAGDSNLPSGVET